MDKGIGCEPRTVPPLYAWSPFSLMKISHWGNLRRQRVDAKVLSNTWYYFENVSQKTYKKRKAG
jgi:hypothetical protein